MLYLEQFHGKQGTSALARESPEVWFKNLLKKLECKLRGGGSTLALVRQNNIIVEALYLYAGLEMDWYVDYGMD